MQKSLIVVLIIAILGAVAIHQLGTTLPAYISFVLGMIVAAVIMVTTQKNNIGPTDSFSGPTMTLYVGNLPYRVHEGEVKALFGEYGSVNSVRLVRDRKTGRRKGFGFVEMSESGAKKAMAKLNDYNFQDRTLKVREAKTQDPDCQDKNLDE
ncbi:RNA-binding protein [Shewanella marina]|uniref:RNA-binding protein n=1 Tax=Shewanella marina TaxID=487319 RepID=UPI0004711B19|nr:RNA-binding protein [Shewanella marina]